MTNKQLVLNQVLEKVNPSKEEINLIEQGLKIFSENLKKRISHLGIKAEIFVGGSFAKKTMIKKDKYDVDVFLRFEPGYKEISEITKKLLKEIKNVSVIHGSRDYFRIKINKEFTIELIPVLKVSKPELSENITDLSYSHVKYINNKIKNKKILDEIKLAKAFCYANLCYGAESYVHGFSGYSLELLVYHYKTFEKFLKEMIKKPKKENKHTGIWTKEYEEKYSDLNKKIIIDIEKKYSSKSQILMDLNSAKLESPIILIDPTYKQRNAAAALSEKTFERFKQAAEEFLKNPSLKSFEIKKTDLEKIKDNATKKKYEFILLEAKTNKQEGDIAGSKLLKFYEHLDLEIKKDFNVKENGFNYNNQKSARFFFVVKIKPEILFEGPYAKDLEHSKDFKKKHKDYVIKKGRIYSKEKPKFQDIKKFIQFWKTKYAVKIKEMYIEKLEIKN